MNSLRSVASRIGGFLAVVGAVSGLWFTAGFLEGDPNGSASDRLGVVTLIGGLGAAVLLGFGRGYLERSTMVASLLGLAVWTWTAVTAGGSSW